MPIATTSDLAARVAELEARLNGGGSRVLLDLLTPPQLAERIGQAERTLSEWRSRGDGPAFIRIGKSVRYRADVVDAWLLGREVSSTKEEARR